MSSSQHALRQKFAKNFFLERAQRHIAPVARFKYAVADAVVVYAVYLSRGGRRLRYAAP